MVVSSFFGLNFVLLCTLSFVKEELGRREGEHGPFLASPCACERKPKASELLLVPHTAPKLYIYMYFFLALPVLFPPSTALFRRLTWKGRKWTVELSKTQCSGLPAPLTLEEEPTYKWVISSRKGQLEACEWWRSSECRQHCFVLWSSFWGKPYVMIPQDWASPPFLMQLHFWGRGAGRGGVSGSSSP